MSNDIKTDKQELESIIRKIDDWNISDWVEEVICRIKSELKTLIEPEKWKPKAYSAWYSITQSGNITVPAVLSDETTSYGNHWSTRKLAETARDMNKRNQYILQAKTERGFGDGSWFIAQGTAFKWRPVQLDYIAIPFPENTFDTKEHAEEVIKMVGLNDQLI